MRIKNLISVIVPVYNVKDYLDECVSSLIAQTYKQLEIILVDDGSKDGSGELCDKYANDDDRIKVIHKSNGGLSSARNAGLDVARGEFVGFVDSDDFLAVDMYQMLHAEMVKNEKVGICSCMIFQYYNCESRIYRKEWNVSEPRFVREDNFVSDFISAKRNFVICSKLFRADVIDSVRFRLGKINEDILFLFDLSPIIEDRHILTLEIPYRGYYYRQRFNSICNNENKPLEISTLENYTEILSYYKREKRFSDYVSILHLYYHILFDLNFKLLKNKKIKSLYFKHYNQEVKSIPIAEIFKIRLPIKDIIKFFYLRCL